MAQRKYTVSIPKRIMEGADTSRFEVEVFAKDTKQAIKRAFIKFNETGHITQDDWRWKNLQVK